MPLDSSDQHARPSHARGSCLLDRPRDEAFDAVTRLVCHTLGVPCALLTLLDGGRQWFVSSHGLDEPWHSRRETPLSHSLCQYVVQYDAPLVIPDTREHPLVRHSLAVTDLHVIAYLGLPLRTADGTPIGSVAAIDSEPREWEPADVELMAEFATLAMAEVRRYEEGARRDRTAAQYEALLRQVPVAVIAAEPQTGSVLYWNERAERLWGAALSDGEPALARAAALATDGRQLRHDELPLARVVAGAPEAALEYQVVRPDGTRWAFDRSFVVRDAAGRPVQCVSLAEDVTDQRRDQNALRQPPRPE
jgi:PAS domain-containing protein